MRLFVAVEFESHVCDAIASAIENFPIKNPPWRWATRATWHLTLKFLGETPESRLDTVSSALAVAVQRQAPFDVVLGALGGFPNLSCPRVLFYRVEEGKAPLSVLASGVEDALATKAGVEREKRPFRAHVTVARIKSALDEAAVAKLPTAPPLAGAAQRVSEISLICSRLTPQGARYERLKQFALPSGP